jgi:hypothetical protein
MSCNCGRCEVKPRSSFVRSVSVNPAENGQGESVDLVLVSTCKRCGGEFFRPLAMSGALACDVLSISAAERQAEYDRRRAAVNAAKRRASVVRGDMLEVRDDAVRVRHAVGAAGPGKPR